MSEKKLRIVIGGDDAVTQVETTATGLRTPEGIGVGSTRAEVQKAYPDAHCDAAADIVDCRVGTEGAGEIVTDYLLRDDRVWRVVVGRIID